MCSCHHFSNHTPETIHLYPSHHSLCKLASVSTTHSTEAHSGFLRKGSIIISFVARLWLFLETPAPALGAQECLLLLSLLLSLLTVLDGLCSLICGSSQSQRTLSFTLLTMLLKTKRFKVHLRRTPAGNRTEKSQSDHSTP